MAGSVLTSGKENAVSGSTLSAPPRNPAAWQGMATHITAPRPADRRAGLSRFWCLWRWIMPIAMPALPDWIRGCSDYCYRHARSDYRGRRDYCVPHDYAREIDLTDLVTT